MTRLAIINPDKCQPKKCKQECKHSCPIVTMGKLCIEVNINDPIAKIAENLCIGCNACVKKCPFKAIDIINLNISENIINDQVHRYGNNGFKLFRLPQPRKGTILGLIGSNGLGKSTILKILGGKIIPELDGKIIEKNEVIKHYRGSDLQSFFENVYNNYYNIIIKPQYVDNIPKVVKGTINKHIKNKSLITKLNLDHIIDRNINLLSGGELQRFTIAVALDKLDNNEKKSIIMFDEPTSYLDIKQRINMAMVIKEYTKDDNYTIVVEHDLSILDYLSDYISLCSGKPSVYGIVSKPYNVRDGINMWLDGFDTTDNLKFRDYPIDFKVFKDIILDDKRNEYSYNKFEIKKDNFTLNSEAGTYSESEIIILLGENGLGKTTFIKYFLKQTKMIVSYKPQKISPPDNFEGTVYDFLYQRVKDKINDYSFINDILKPLNIIELYEQKVKILSGGELQRVAIALCLSKNANIYFIDEPSSYLDTEMRMISAKIIKKFIYQNKKTAFIVEHDFMMATYLADKTIIFNGTPGYNGMASQPLQNNVGINEFLKILNITYRNDYNNGRPRINKLNSAKDIEQKNNGNYYIQ